jgi:hypothetical protein
MIPACFTTKGKTPVKRGIFRERVNYFKCKNCRGKLYEVEEFPVGNLAKVKCKYNFL